MQVFYKFLKEWLTDGRIDGQTHLEKPPRLKNQLKGPNTFTDTFDIGLN